MPGVLALSSEKGVNTKTVNAALGLLEAEGLLINQGQGRRRLITKPRESTSLRVEVLPYERIERIAGHFVQFLHHLGDAGHTPFFATSSIVELGRDPERVASYIGRNAADAWIVAAGSVEILQRLVAEKVPVFALFGRREGLSLAGGGVDKAPVFAEIARKSVELGHRRIVLLSRTERRLPNPGEPEKAFLRELAKHGLSKGSYNIPDWEDSPEGFNRCLESLFKHTPPTVVLIEGAPLFFAALKFFSGQGIRVPEDVSMVCSDFDPAFSWFPTSVAHIQWNSLPLVHSVVRWANNVSQGRKDCNQVSTNAKFVDGGTLTRPSR